jgi:hypothetical protein
MAHSQEKIAVKRNGPESGLAQIYQTENFKQLL